MLEERGSFVKYLFFCHMNMRCPQGSSHFWVQNGAAQDLGTVHMVGGISFICPSFKLVVCSSRLIYLQTDLEK